MPESPLGMTGYLFSCMMEEEKDRQRHMLSVFFGFIGIV